MSQLTIERLTEAVRGGAVALRSIMRLQPVEWILNAPSSSSFPALKRN
ncbi:MAG: hypothetical protein OXI96_03540 [Acidimicrobiaceae bacterium]|nr:hypothetical protein [Acidimicrobiaceae bacterium]